MQNPLNSFGDTARETQARHYNNTSTAKDHECDQKAVDAEEVVDNTPTASIFLDDVAADEPELLDSDARAQLFINTVDNLE